MLGFSGCRGVRIVGFQKSYVCKKINLAAEGGRKNCFFFFCCFFVVKNQDVSGKMTNLGAFQILRMQDLLHFQF